MNQRIAVRAIILKDGKTLLLRRSSGRDSILGKYELPGGKFGYGEQPEEALGRLVKENTGASVQSARLFDIVTYIDSDDDDFQYVFVLYLVHLESKIHKIILNPRYDHYVWRKDPLLEPSQLTESTKLMLDILQHNSSSVKDNSNDNDDVIPTTEKSHLVIYSDGGSRGNPGPSASGFVVMNSNQQVIDEGGQYLGITTNNQAEYHGVRLGLEKALELGARTVDFRIDSLLVVNQMNNIYTIKNRELWPINERIRELTAQFDKVRFTHVKREFNQLADGVVNKILNAHAQQ